MSADTVETEVEVEEPTLPGTEPLSEEAPFGYKLDGTPRKSNSGRRPSVPGQPRKAAAPKARTSSSAARAKSGPDYRPALVGLAAIPTMVLGLVARTRKDPRSQQRLRLDGLTIKVHAPALADAVNETAKTNRAVQDALEKVIAAGPAGLIFAAAAPMVMQILANHEKVPVVPEMGILSAEQLVSVAA